MLLAKLKISVGKKVVRSGKETGYAANDNPSREQVLFEKCIERELGSFKTDQ